MGYGLFSNQFVSDTSHIDDAYMVVLGQFVAELGDEDVQAALVEEGVVAPKVEQDITHVHHAVAVLAKAAQDFGFAM